jgi:phage terminase small subunit
MPPLKKPRQEKLAKALASGLPLAKAAKKAGYKPNAVSACQTAKKVNVSERIEELREIAEEKLEMDRLHALQIAWNRYCTDHKDAKGYLDTILKAQGWNEPEKIDVTHNVDPVVELMHKIRERQNG